MADLQEPKGAAPEVRVDDSARRLLAGYEQGSEAAPDKPASRRSWAFVFGGVMLVALVIASALIYYSLFRRGVGVKNKAGQGRLEQQEVNPSVATDAALNTMKEALGGPVQMRPGQGANAPPATSGVTPHAGTAGKPATGQIRGDLASTVVPEGFESKPKESPEPGGVSKPRAAPVEGAGRGGPGHSIWFDPRARSAAQKGGEGEARPQLAPQKAASESAAVPAKPVPAIHREAPKAAFEPRNTPEFGAMLPVQTLGILYTLRGASLVRMQLVREVKGRNWRLGRGTILVGQVQGATLDRAYVQTLGYVSQETGGLVRMGGEVLGSDGGAGLKGRQRKVSRNWGRVLDRVAQHTVQALSSILGRNSQVVVAANPSDIYGSSGVFDRRREMAREFVEVAAGTVGFVLVTDLPPAESHLASSPMAASRGRAAQLSDEDLVQMLTAEDPAAAIRGVLPRAGAEMRDILERVLREVEADAPRSGR